MPDITVQLQQEIQQLRSLAQSQSIPDELRIKIEKDIVALERSVQMGTYDEKYEKVSRYIQLVTSFPWGKSSETNLDLAAAKQVFEQHHYGLQEVKDRFFEYISVLKLLRDQEGQDYDTKSPVLLLVGLVGTGKTTFAYSLAEALGRKIVRIPFGGMGSARELRGQTRLNLEAEAGKIIKGLVSAQVNNPVILLDEIDRVSEEARMDVMGVLVELLDPAQNHAFVDSYLDYPVDLSHVIFIATANNTTKIATAVLDRMEKISMPSYSDQEKIVIAKNYILPQMLKESGLRAEQLKIDDSLWPQMVRPLGFDAGIRTLQRTLQGLVRKAARIMVEKGYNEVIVNPQNVKIFLPQY